MKVLLIGGISHGEIATVAEEMKEHFAGKTAPHIGQMEKYLRTDTEIEGEPCCFFRHASLKDKEKEAIAKFREYLKNDLTISDLLKGIS
jgi:hypothetical protein